MTKRQDDYIDATPFTEDEVPEEIAIEESVLDHIRPLDTLVGVDNSGTGDVQ